MNRQAERRKHPRKQVAVKSRIADDVKTSDFVTVDLSANGLSCWLDRPLNAFTKVKITLMIPSSETVAGQDNHLRPVECEGVVVRSAKQRGSTGYHTAIFFNHIDLPAMELIQQYVASHKH